MTVALLFIFAVATPLAVLELVLGGRLDLAAIAALPLGLLLLFGFFTSPSRLVIREDSVDLPKARMMRALGARSRVPLAEIVNIYPTFYEDIAMRLSPFASAEGTAKHAGIGVETADGGRIVIAFTPTVLNLRKHGTPPYHAGLEAVREACTRAGRPMVTKPPAYSASEIEAMLIEAARPLLPFPVTAAGLMAPAVLIPALGAGLASVWGPLSSAALLLVAAVGLSPLMAVFAYVNLRGGRRARLLHEVQKHRQHLKEAQGTRSVALD